MRKLIEYSPQDSGIKSSRKYDSSEWSEFEKEMQYERKLNGAKAKGSFKRSLDVIMGVSRPLN